MYTSYKKANMSDSTLLNSLPRIYFDRKKSRGISYVKAFDGNAWDGQKGYAVKINTRTIGVIDSPDAEGLIRFNNGSSCIFMGK